MNHDEPIADLLDLATEMFREAIETHLAVEENRDLIHETFDQLVDEAIGSGHVSITGKQLKRMTKDYLWARLNSRAGRATQSVLKELTSGQVKIFEVDEVLDTPITAGSARRTLIRHLVKPDVRRMVTEREENLAKQVAAFAEFRDRIAVTLEEWLDQHGSIAQALDAGAIELVDEAAS